MSGNPKIHFIPAVPKREKRVAIYARVSTNDAEQEEYQCICQIRLKH